MKDPILRAAIQVLVRHGLNNWTVEEVARQAKCAKGLVNYHYRSKQQLLVRAAEALRDERATARQAAATSPEAEALDRLWGTLREEVRSGRFAAWLSLLAADPPLRKAASSGPTQLSAFASALSHTLGLEDQLAVHAALIDAALNGLQLRLLQGAPGAEGEPEAEEAYHRFWLTVLEM